MSIRYEFDHDATLNNSSKVFTVPAGQIWIITHVHARLVATADAGNRRLRVIARDTSDNIYTQVESPVTFAATETQDVDFFPGASDSASEVNNTIKVSLPVMILLPGHDLVVEDGAAIAASADDLVVDFVRSIRTP